MNQKHTEEAAVRNISRAAFNVGMLMVTSSPAEREQQLTVILESQQQAKYLRGLLAVVSELLSLVGGVVGGGGSQNFCG